MGPRRGLWVMLAVCGLLGSSHSPRDARAQQVDAAGREFFLLLERLGGEYGADAELEAGTPRNSSASSRSRSTRRTSTTTGCSS